MNGQITIFEYLNEINKVCRFSKHSCNQTELWKVAHSLDNINCPEVCCRRCAVIHCGARCNGSDEPKPIESKDDYIRDNPTCFYVFGHYLDKEQGWHKVPDCLPTFNTWTLVDVVLFGEKTGTAWMEHEKWEAKDWTFRSVDDKRKTESTKVLAWKLSEKQED